MSQANWTAIEDAIHDEVATALGVAGSLVIWEHQTGDRIIKTDGSPVFATLRMDAIKADWSPDYSTELIPLASAPVDLTLSTSAHTEATITIQVFAKASTGTNAAYAKCEKVAKIFDRESAIIRLEDAGISVLDRAPVTPIPAILETKWESRATFSLRVGVRSGDEEITTWIETVDSTVTFT